jgi:hypothetical protein
VAIGAQLIALAGVLLGVVATTAGGGESGSRNDFYHYTMIVLLGCGIAVLTIGRRTYPPSDSGARAEHPA